MARLSKALTEAPTPAPLLRPPLPHSLEDHFLSMRGRRAWTSCMDDCEQVRALFDFGGVEPGDLPFKEGDTFEVQGHCSQQELGHTSTSASSRRTREMPCMCLMSWSPHCPCSQADAGEFEEHKDDGGWVTGWNLGRDGVFPSNYVQPM